jgi:hypothetical protein
MDLRVMEVLLFTIEISDDLPKILLFHKTDDPLIFNLM